MFKKKLVPLEPSQHTGRLLQIPENYLFAKDIEIVPIGFTEIVPCSMWYPIFFGKRGDELMVFAALGAAGHNVYLNADGTWKVKIIPKAISLYPFHVAKQKEDYIILVDETFLGEEIGELLFDAEQNPSPYLQNIKYELTNFAQDIQQASLIAKELFDSGLLTLLEINHTFSFGKFELKSALTADMKALIKTQPEKLYYLNIKGILPILFSQNLSLRNFTLFEIFHAFEGQLPF